MGAPGQRKLVDATKMRHALYPHKCAVYDTPSNAAKYFDLLMQHEKRREAAAQVFWNYCYTVTQSLYMLYFLQKRNMIINSALKSGLIKPLEK